MKKVMGIVVALVVFCASFAVAADPVTLKFSVVEPPQAFAPQQIWAPWIQKINKEAEGLFKIEMYAGTLHRDQNQNLKVVLDGIADFSFAINSYHGGVFADDSVFELPFVATNAVEASTAAWAMYKKGMLRGYDIIVPLMLAVGRPYTIHSTIPVKVPEDLKGKKMRASGKIQQAMAEVLGAAPVGLPVTQIAESLSRGIIQATTNEWNAVRTFKIEEVAKYHCEVPLGSLSFSLIMNKQKFASLPQKAQDILIANQDYVRNLWATKMDEDLTAYEKKMQADPSQKFYFPTEKDNTLWKEASDKAVAAWVKDNPEKGNALLNAYIEEVKKARGSK